MTGKQASQAPNSPTDSHAGDIVAFVGPSLRPEDVTHLQSLARSRSVPLRLEPPVRRHDLLAACEAGGCSLAVILDGEFGQNLAVSISEIRAALTSGLRLHGASSMGVLRAVECRRLGMTGSGWVFEQYLTGRIESDAEVALLYDPFDYLPITLPLVNIRWLLEETVRLGGIGSDDAALALDLARRIHFRQRRPEVLGERWRSGLSAAVWEVLRPQLAAEARDRWDRKRLDGLAAMTRILGV